MSHSPKSTRSIALMAAVACVCAHNASAEDVSTHVSESSSPEATLSLEDILNLKVSVASKMDESIADAPSSVSVFTHAEIVDLGITRLEDLLNFVPGFITSREVQQGSMSRITVRGRSTPLSEAVLILVDGQRINDLYTGGATLLNRNIEVENIKRIEVVRGPGSALYGSNAFLGVISIVTQDGVSGGVFKAGDFFARRGKASFAKTYDNGISVHGSASAFSDEGQTLQVTDLFGETRDTSDPRRGMDLLVGAKYKGLSLDFRHMERGGENYLIFGRIGQYLNHEKTLQSSVTAKYSAGLTQSFQFDVSGGFQRSKLQGMTRILPPNLPPANADDVATVGGVKLQEYSGRGNVDLRFQPIETNKLIAGVAFERAAMTDMASLYSHDSAGNYQNGPIIDLPEPFNSETPRTIWGVYLQDQQSIGNWLSLIAGARLDSYSDIGTSINPRAAAIFSAPWDGKFKLMYGQAFRAPSYIELYDRNNPIDYGNTELHPEKVETIEVAYVQSFKKAQATATLFRNKIKDFIVIGDPVTAADNPFGAGQWTNSGTDTWHGLELETRASLIGDLTLYGSLTQIFGTPRSDTPNTLLSAILNYKLSRFNFNTSALYRDAFGAFSSQVLFNLAVRVNVLSKLTLEGAVLNLSDRRYTSLAKGDQTDLAVPNRGREWFAGLRYEM